MTKPICVTKKLESLLRRNSVELRNRNSTVVHLTTGASTECDPATFAVFEASIKSAYLSNACHPMWSAMCKAGHDKHYLQIARQNEFSLPDASNVPEKEREKRGRKAADDYQYCVSLIRRAGLYYKLLD